MNILSAIKNKFSWDFGRQLSGYKKFKIAESLFPIPFDMYILNFPEGTSIPEHVDPVQKGFKHFRLNIIIKKSTSGGEFLSEKSIISLERIKFFRPDIYKHSVTKVEGGSRIVFSFGFLIKDKGE